MQKEQFMLLSRLRILSVVTLLVLTNGALLLWLQSHPSAAAYAQAPSIAAAQAATVAPATFSYQGTLRQVDGALANGQFQLTINLYNVPVAGTSLYNESFPAVAVTDGLFSIVIGDQAGKVLDPALFASPNIFLGVTVNSDAELLPRQRLHPVPLAMGLTAGGGVPGLVSLGGNGNKVIEFPKSADGSKAGGAIFYDTTALQILPGQFKMNGNLAVDGSLGVNAGLLVNSGATVNGNLVINGGLTDLAIREIGDSKGNPVQRADYAVSVNRYVVGAQDNGGTPSSVPVADPLLMQLCGDEDGCSLTLGMRNNTPQQSDNRFIMSFPYSFAIAGALGGKRFWHVAGFNDQGVAVGPDGLDGANNSENVVNSGDCRFTDGAFANGADQGDTGLGFALLNWIGQGGHNSPDLVCVLVIKD